ncbi:ABC transporter ATP-binding protein [Alkalihalobacillus sp. LMS39]|uniref:ATP-binding cassette domain-containing protein n=1 Tax=Alkalihalobacillus sp. LMS39 TaxID=2924032 RepID=UPI001FB2CC3F|nr:ABC transporter ATP-binding protein [Alkalihalobacillus sp. LMS39]UOE96137.1 ABC transporter ATP-binding protein [Alkalihalobacillus sp. LMS39]
MNVIKLSGVKKKIDKSFDVGPLHLEVNKGTVTALIGNNGAGKSTLLRLLTGMIYPDTGVIDRFGFTDDEIEWKEWIGYVPQTSIGYDRFTLAQLADLHSIGFREWDNKKFFELLQQFHIPYNKRLDTLSVGMQKKALLFLALARQTKMLLMDEPLSGVDIESQEKIRELWVHYLEEDPERSILFSSHVPDEIKEFADYIVGMDDGRIIGNYEKDNLLQSYVRFWVKGDSTMFSNVPGVISVTESGNQCELLSTNQEETEKALHTMNSYILTKKSLRFAEILSFILRKQKGEQNNDITIK